MKAIHSLPGRATFQVTPMLVSLFMGSSVYTPTNNAIGVIEDAKFKRREALADLAKAAAKK
jgi:hypothetical protein